MNLLLIDKKTSIRDLLIKRLFPKGVNVYQAEDIEKGKTLLDEVDYNYLLIDIDADPKASIQFLQYVSKLPSKPVRVVTSSINDKRLIMPLVNAGIAGYIIKPFTEEQSLPKLFSILEKTGGDSNQRNFYRVAPNPGEETKVFFRTRSNSKLITAQMINISAGGIALQTKEEIDDEDLQQSSFIPKIQLKLNNKDVILSGIVVYRKGPVFAIRFQRCSEVDIYQLSKYIFDRLSETH